MHKSPDEISYGMRTMDIPLEQVERRIQHDMSEARRYVEDRDLTNSLAEEIVRDTRFGREREVLPGGSRSNARAEASEILAETNRHASQLVYRYIDEHHLYLPGRHSGQIVAEFETGILRHVVQILRTEQGAPGREGMLHDQFISDLIGEMARILGERAAESVNRPQY